MEGQGGFLEKIGKKVIGSLIKPRKYRLVDRAQESEFRNDYLRSEILDEKKLRWEVSHIDNQLSEFEKNADTLFIKESDVPPADFEKLKAYSGKLIKAI